MEEEKTLEFTSRQSSSDKKIAQSTKGDNGEYQVNFSAFIAES